MARAWALSACPRSSVEVGTVMYLLSEGGKSVFPFYESSHVRGRWRAPLLAEPGLSSPSLRGITSTTWSIDRGTCPSSLSSWRRGCHLRPSRPRRSKSTSSTRSDIVQVRAEVLVRLPGVAVGAVALPEARKHWPMRRWARTLCSTNSLSRIRRFRTCATFGGTARDRQDRLYHKSRTAVVGAMRGV